MLIKTSLAFFLSGVLLAACVRGQNKPAVPELLKTEWRLEDLGGNGILDRVQPTLAFPEQNKVAGNGSCNRFFGSVEIKGDTIRFGQLASTRMACLSAAMSNQESNYLDAIKNAEHLSLEGPWLLIYSKGLDKPLRFTQIPPKQ
jgi:heat shock protein HslJ